MFYWLGCKLYKVGFHLSILGLASVVSSLGFSSFLELRKALLCSMCQSHGSGTPLLVLLSTVHPTDVRGDV